jgi:hypothetical protein
MSRHDAVVLTSRALSVIFLVWALSEVSALPEVLHSFLHYIDQVPGSASSIGYWRHYYLIRLGFLVVRIVGFSLMASWLYKGGREVEEMLLPSGLQENPVQD